MSDDIRLDLLRDAICRSDLDGQTKDALADRLYLAADMDADPDADFLYTSVTNIVEAP
jgi:hypothetical protein